MKPQERKKENNLHDIMGDFMVDLCEQKGHPKDCHICQPNNILWKRNYKRFLALQNKRIREVIGKIKNYYLDNWSFDHKKEMKIFLDYLDSLLKDL